MADTGGGVMLDLVSKKLGASATGTGALAYLTSLGLHPEKAGYLVAAITIVYLVMQGLIDIKKAKADGKLTLDEIKDIVKKTEERAQGPQEVPAAK